MTVRSEKLAIISGNEETHMEETESLTSEPANN